VAHGVVLRRGGVALQRRFVLSRNDPAHIRLRAKWPIHYRNVLFLLEKFLDFILLQAVGILLLHRVGIYHSLETRRTTTFVQVGSRSRRRPARRDAVAARVEVTALAAGVPIALPLAHDIAAVRAEARPIERLASTRPHEPTSSLHLHEPSKMLART
jgi:hypothetical protein